MKQKGHFFTLVMVVCMLLAVFSVSALAAGENPCTDGDNCIHQAAIGSTHYATLDEAVSAVQSNETIQLLANVQLTENTPIKIVDKGTEDNPITLDLNGHTISGSNSKSATGNTAAQSGILTVCGSRVELKDSSENGGGKIINTATDASTSSVVTVLPSDANSANLVVGSSYGAAVTLENKSTKSNSVGMYVCAPSDGNLQAYVIVNDARIKSYANAVSTDKGGRATADINGGTFETVSTAKSSYAVAYNVKINGGTFIRGNLQSKLDNVDEGCLILLEKNADGAIVYTVVDEDDADYAACVEGTKICVKAGTDLSILNEIGQLTGTVQVVKDAKLNLDAFGAADKAAPTALTLDLANGVTLSGSVPVMLADITVTGNGTAQEGMFIAAEGYQVELVDGVYQGRFAEETLGATVVGPTGMVSYYSKTNLSTVFGGRSPLANISNCTVTLYADYDAKNVVTNVKAKNVLDLNGHTYVYSGTSAAFICNQRGASLEVKGGTIQVANREGHAIGTAASMQNCYVKIAEDAVLDGGGVLITGENHTVDVYGKIEAKGIYAAIQGNGSDTVNSTINIYDGAVIKADDIAIYHPQAGTLTIEGGEISAATAIYMKSGTLSVTGGTITGTGEKQEYSHNGNGADPTGDAIVLEACSYPRGVPNVTGFGGDNLVVISKNAAPVACYLKEGSNDITNKKFISGGNYSDSVMEYVVESLSAELISKAINPDAPYSYHNSYDEAMAAAENAGDTNAKIVMHDAQAATTVILKPNGGSVSVVEIKAANNANIKLPTPTRSGYSFQGWYDENNKVSNPYTVSENVTLTAQWAYIAPTYSITTPEVDNGSITVSPKAATGGRTVTITVTPDEGYKLDTLTVTDAKGNEIALTDLGGGKYSFKMPYSKVTVNATFVETEPEPVIDPVKDCPKDETCPAAKFEDVKLDEWYHDGVHYCIVEGLMNGTGATTFEPDNTTERAMLVTVLYRLEGKPEVGSCPFTDVWANEWYTDAITWAAENKIVEGYGDGTFGPEDNITREQMATILYRYAKYKGYDVTATADITTFVDGSDTEDWAADAMAWAVAEKLINGIENNQLDPQGDATRAQMATILYRFCENVAK